MTHFDDELTRQLADANPVRNPELNELERRRSEKHLQAILADARAGLGSRAGSGFGSGRSNSGRWLLGAAAAVSAIALGTGLLPNLFNGQEATATAEEIRQLDQKIAALNKLHKKNVQKAKDIHRINLLKTADDSNVFKRVINPIKSRDRNYVTHLDEGDRIISDPAEVATKIIEEYCPATADIDFDVTDITTEEPDSPQLTEEEIEFAIYSMKSNKAPGDDRLSSELIQKWFEKDRHYLIALFRYWFSSCDFPAQYRSSLIVPVIKAKEKGCKIGNLRCLGMLTHIS